MYTSGDEAKEEEEEWSLKEIGAAYSTFKQYIQGRFLPDVNLCEKEIERNPVLQKKTPTQIRSWIKQEIGRNVPNGKLRKPWTTPEVKIIRKRFSHHLSRGSYPSRQEYEKLVSEYPLLRHRSSTSIKSFMQYDRNKTKR